MRQGLSVLVRRSLAAALVVTVLFAIAACSGGSSQAAKAAFVAQGNQLCKQFADDYNAAKAQLPIPPSNDDLKLLAQATFVPAAIETYQKIASLNLPKADAQDLTSLMDQAIAEVRLIQADPLQGGSPSNQRDIVNRMHGYGLTECGVGFAHDVDHAEFVKEADGICGTYFAKLSKVEQDQNVSASSKDDVKIAFATNTGLPVVRDAVDRIEAIGFPPEDKAVLSKLIGDWRADLDAVAKDPAQFFTPNRATAVDIFQRWAAFGLTSCAAPIAR